MTRKDFVLIARVIRDANLAPGDRVSIAYSFADELRHTNPNFDRDRFLDAALPLTEQQRCNICGDYLSECPEYRAAKAESVRHDTAH